MMVQDTSREAYHEYKRTKLKKSQSVVLDVIRYLGNPTNSEIRKFIGLPINVITPRTNELVKLGKVIEGEKRSCKVTHKTVLTWRAV